MKQRLHFIVLAFLALSSFAQNIGDAFYIYRNDGQFNAFFRDEVDSIAYSYYDADSIRYEEVVTQTVYTADSIYRIPLAAIDSVGFVQQAPVYEDNTTELSGQLVDYIVSVDDMVINMRGDTPDNLLPKKGEKLAQLGFTSLFPDGFVGQVVSVTKNEDIIRVACDSLTIDDVVKSYSAVYRLEITDDNKTLSKGLNASAPIDLFNRTLPTVTIPIHMNLEALGGVWENETLNEETGLGGSGDIMIGITPTYNIKVAYYKNALLNVFPRYNMHVVTDVSVREEIQLMGIINGERKWPIKLPGLLEKFKDFPIAPGVTLYLDAGFKVSGQGRLGAGAVFKQSVRHVMDINFYPLMYPLVPPVSTATHHLNITSHDEEWLYFLGDFEAKIGPFLEVGFGLLNHRVSKVGAEFDCGAKFSGSVKFDPVAWRTAETTTNFYENCKDDSKMEFNVYLGGSIIAAALDEKLKFSRGGDIDLPLFHKEAMLLPSFSNVTFVQKAGSLKASAKIGNNCIFPLKVGATLFNSEGRRLKTESYGEEYWTPNSFKNYVVTFDDVPLPGKFSAYPTVRLFGKDILAMPQAELTVTFPVELSDFKVTNSQHQKNGFSHNGQQYDYSFDVSVTATLDEDAQDISEWGYAYLDNNGNEALIPLSDFGRTYTDTRYAYYRKEAHSECTLYGYVKYKGSDKPVYGEPHDYPLEHETLCPDENHPHWIDLGLPSGTQWRCCNIGASSPEQYGSYMSQTQASSSPSLTQIEELLSNTSYEWTTLDGVKGGKFTGSNGSAVFLPAAGSYLDGELSQEGKYGCYWSSTIHSQGRAYGVSFNSNEAHCNSDGYRYDASSVRPVR